MKDLLFNSSKAVANMNRIEDLILYRLHGLFRGRSGRPVVSGCEVPEIMVQAV